MRCRYFWVENNFSLCVSEVNLNYNCIAAQSRDSNQAEAKPCWTRLNQAWTSSTQHALRFKPWLIGLKASKSPFPAVTGIGLGKESDGAKGRKEQGRDREISFSLHQFTHAPLDQYHFSSLFRHSLYSVCTAFFIGSADREPQMLHLHSCPVM